MVAAKNAGRAGSLLLGMALLALSGSQWVSPARADEPAKELSAEEHDRLLKEAADLDGRAGRLIQKGDRAAAVDLLQQLLAVRRGLYLADKSPEAQRELARVLNNLGMMQESVGKYADAADSLQKALDTYRDLYPRDKYPDGHAVVAHALNNLGGLYWSTGEYAKAESYFRDALDMLRKLHTDGKLFAVTLNNLGTVLRAQGKYDEAADCYEQALEFFRKASPRDLFPIAHGLANLADLMQEVRKYDKAGDYYLQSLEMLRQIYPVESHPDGRPDLVLRLNDLGLLMQEQGKYDEAEGYQREALEMARKLYPAERCPAGSPELEDTLNYMGALRNEQGKYAEAAALLSESLTMHDHIVRAFADAAAEAEALNFIASRTPSRDFYLTAVAHLPDADAPDHYPVLWLGKTTLARSLERRRRLVAALSGDAADKARELLAARQNLARAVLTPANGDADARARLVKDLTDRKERLEKELARQLPPSSGEAPPYGDLVARLPDHAAFVDLYRYQEWDPAARKWGGGQYVAFLLRKGRPVRRAVLGDAAPIEKDLVQWRDDIGKGFRSDAADRLRKSVWEPIARIMGDGVEVVYVCPDGRLSAMPWAALPGERPGSVLLEDYTFAVVPHGSLLLEQLSRPGDASRGKGALLAVGGVSYDRDGAPADKAGKPWPVLPASDKERSAVVALARKLAAPPEIFERFGADADVAHLLKDLPKARWAHLATHGFFAAPDTKEREHLFRPDDFAFGVTPQGGRLDRRGAAARNPLTQSGLVLAGANQPTDTDTSLLTGEAIAGLDLDGMDLAVLSACRTGLGEQSAGEGVFGLQRAFHIAGARNVIASLWTVDDDATAALMNLFYYHFWEKNEPPLEALHHAQLELYRNPQALSGLAKGRGAADWDDTVRVVTKPPSDPKAAPRRPAAVRDWAAFVLSGAGR